MRYQIFAVQGDEVVTRIFTEYTEKEYEIVSQKVKQLREMFPDWEWDYSDAEWAQKK